ncbi:hypothetical protein BDA96_10G304100 [Sorghum bicolor]|uniref:Uncharacterized protein n=1 Tax=Sorghum bicolor TaxID=4558 RepID=A0A921U2K6_SORBI|nr:hypothetical protein BDA96_10G304100 [Sorghum bicolor]
MKTRHVAEFSKTSAPTPHHQDFSLRSSFSLSVITLKFRSCSCLATGRWGTLQTESKPVMEMVADDKLQPRPRASSPTTASPTPPHPEFSLTPNPAALMVNINPAGISGGLVAALVVGAGIGGAIVWYAFSSSRRAKFLKLLTGGYASKPEDLHGVVQATYLIRAQNDEKRAQQHKEQYEKSLETAQVSRALFDAAVAAAAAPAPAPAVPVPVPDIIVEDPPAPVQPVVPVPGRRFFWLN